MTRTKPYLTAAELGITEEERAALLTTIDVLRAEQVHFDMTTPCSIHNRSPCKTNMCIGGTMSLLMQNDLELPKIVTRDMLEKMHQYTFSVDDQYNEDTGDVIRERSALYPLFFDRIDERRPKEGIKAINRFLRGSRHPWKD